jgi:hypothetical protein
MLAHAFLVVAALTERTRHPTPPELIPITCNEIQHLFAALLARSPGELADQLHWSLWHTDIKPALAPATTADKPPGSRRRDPRCVTSTSKETPVTLPESARPISWTRHVWVLAPIRRLALTPGCSALA